MPKHDKEQNLNAGLLTEEDGPDQATREAILTRLQAREPSVVGNLADLQRAGGLIATSQASSFAEGVEPPPGKTTEGLKAEAEVAAKANEAIATAIDDVNAAKAEANVDATDGKDVKDTKSKK